MSYSRYQEVRVNSFVRGDSDDVRMTKTCSLFVIVFFFITQEVFEVSRRGINLTLVLMRGYNYSL